MQRRGYLGNHFSGWRTRCWRIWKERSGRSGRICRLDGMDYALRRIEKIGTEEFRKELKVRYRNGLSVQIPPKELCDASDRIKEMCLDTVLTMATLVLHDEFDFGKKRVQRFYDRFMKKADCLRGDFVT